LEQRVPTDHPLRTISDRVDAALKGMSRDFARLYARLLRKGRDRGCTPHVSQNDTNRRSAIDARTTRHPGYRISTVKRKRIEEPFGWIKTVGGLRKPPHRGRVPIEWFFAAACNLVRIPMIPAAMG
jgi:hypothetical protein